MRYALGCCLALGAALAVGAACRPAEGTGEAQEARASLPERESVVGSALSELREWEVSTRARTDFATLPTADRVLGPDPYALVPMGERWVGVLRGSSALVLLDSELREIDRAACPPSPTGIAVGPRGQIVVGSELVPVLGRFHVEGDRLRRVPDVAVPKAGNTRDVTLGMGGLAHVVDEVRHELATVDLSGQGSGEAEVVARRQTGLGPVDVERVGDALLVLSILDQSLRVYSLDEGGHVETGGERTIRHDGPLWGFAAAQDEAGLLVAAGGVEDHPLDRTGGFFGYVDSFVFLYRVPARGEPERLATVNVSEHGAITPKSLLLDVVDGGASVVVVGYGGDTEVRLSFEAPSWDAPSVATGPDVPPGAASVRRGPGGERVYANPLLDAWVMRRGETTVVEPVASETSAARSFESKVGEALFFTGLMAPEARTEGALSRFTCETCHFEGYVDGRTHHTGRRDVHATTKPLLGLFNNGPHFSRALDRDLTQMVHAEFRVAGAKSGHDPWFSVRVESTPWLRHLGAAPTAELEPAWLRRALMRFLMDFTHRENPAVAGRHAMSGRERRGAVVFRDQCEGCHAARLDARNPHSRVPFERWEELILSQSGPIVWGRVGYEKTGVEPYVHRAGARVPSLRRLYKKRPYFTNGSAPDVGTVLERARWRGGVFTHDGSTDGTALSAEQQASLTAFLRLL